MTVNVERRDNGQLSLTLSRPRQRNAITVAMYAALADAVEGAAGDPSVRVITIEGEGEDFTAGNDLYDFLKELPPPGTTDIPVWRFLRAMTKNQVPIVAAVHGNAVGIGTTMLFHCDLVLGEPFGAEAAAEFGLVSHVVPKGEIAAALAKIVAALLAKPPEALRQTQALLRREDVGELLDRIELENSHFGERLASDEVKQAIASFFAAKASASA